MADVTFRIHADLDSLSRAAALRISALAAEACAARGAFHIALSGGSTPRRLYETLAGADFRDSIDWSRVHIYFGDERCVPPEHPDSNYGMAAAALLNHVPIPPQQVYRIAVTMSSVRQDAWRYAQLIAAQVPRDAQGVPSFDLVLLGMGPDGHTASLFPYSCILRVHQFAAAVYVDKFKSWRISITYPLLNHARRLMFLVAGADKADMLRRIHVDPRGNTPVPIQRIAAQGAVEWLLDSAAAAHLPRAMTS
jgi:6-phosphogluconolactonase